MQKSGKTSKIDFYKFISPKGQKAGDDSEGTVAANIISTKVVKTEKRQTTTKTEPKTTMTSKLPIWQAIIFGAVFVLMYLD